MRTFESVFHTHPSVATPVGWDRCRFLQMPRAVWLFEREFLDVKITYRNLDKEQDFNLPGVSCVATDDQLLQMFVEQYESHTPGDFVQLGDKLLTVSFDRGSA